MCSCRNASTQRFAAAASPLLHPLHRRDPLVALVGSARMHLFAMALSGVSSRSQVDRLSLVSRLSLSVCYNTRRPCVLQVFARAKDLAWLRHPSQLNADRSALLLAFQPQPFAMNLIRGIDPDSHLLGVWQLDSGKLNTSLTSRLVLVFDFLQRLMLLRRRVGTCCQPLGGQQPRDARPNKTMGVFLLAPSQ